MSNRLTKGKAVAGRLAQDLPGLPEMGPAFRILNPASSAEKTTGFVFGENDILTNFLVKVTSVTATSATLSIGLLSSAPTGFVTGLPVGSTGFKVTMYAVSTSGDSPNWISTSYAGSLLNMVNTGTTALSGGFIPRPYALNSTTVKTLSYTYNSTAAFAATIYPIFYTLNP